MRRIVLKRGIFTALVMCTGLLFSGKLLLNNIGLSREHTRRPRYWSLNASRRPFVAPAPQKYDVILSAYMNSGSRFTGRLLGFREDSFYFYEPLWRFSTWDFYRPPNLVCSSTHGTCRKTDARTANTFKSYPDGPEEKLRANISESDDVMEMMVDTLADVYRCDLQALKNLVVLRVHDNHQYAGPSWDIFRQCKDRLKSVRDCLKELESVCLNASQRVSKVIRLSLGSFRPLLEANRNLRLLHLFRDPRAIINSRLQSRGYPMPFYRDNATLEQNLCKKMLSDVKEGLYLMKLYPDRVKFVFYEDAMNDTNKFAREVYSFFGMSYNSSSVTRLSHVKTNLALPERPDKSRDRERFDNNAFWWRQYMTWREVTQVDQYCSSVYQYLGYRKFSSEDELRKVSILSFAKPELSYPSNVD